MSDIFTSGFLGMLDALARVFIIIIVAGLLVRKKIISQKQIEALSKVTVIVLLPSLVFANTIKHFNPDSLPYWWLLPLIGILMSTVGFLFASGVFAPDFRKQKNMIALSSMQNAGYLVLPIGQVVYPDKFEEFALITFLFILGYNPLLWTLGKYLVTSKDEKVKFHYKDLITPPAVANILSLIIVLIGIQKIFPVIIIDSVSLIGDAAVPVATFVLGATLGTVSLRKFPNIWNTIRVIFVKYLLLPIATIGVLIWFNVAETNPLLADFFIIQAAAAPATGLILQVRTYGGDVNKVAGMMLITYIACLIALPFWIAVWHMIV
ncbi:MAG: AEC family transporter [Bacteroidales bacterium]|nr:AEC family transporter [Bacteroidales bacterium]